MVARPDPSSPASFYTSLQAVCDAVDTAASRIADLQQALANTQDAVNAEARARQAADTGLAQDRANGDQAEGRARQDGINAEANARNDAIATAIQPIRRAISDLGDSLREALNAETTARTSGDAAEQKARSDAIQAQAQALADAVSDLEALINSGGAKQDKALSDAVTALQSLIAGQRFDLLSAAGRPGTAPLRYTFTANPAILGGPRPLLPFLPPQMLATGDNGPVVRVSGPGIVAARDAYPLEPGRLYRSRYVVQRRSNPADPTGDAVVCGILYLDQSLRVLGAVVPVRTYPSLVTANGRQECEALIARSAGLGAAFQAPPSARFIVPIVAMYGPDALTDVEVLSVEDVTGAFVLAPPIANFEARLAALESADLMARLQVLESEAGTPSKLTFGSKGDAAYAVIPAGVQVVELLGRKFAGDGGGGRYVRTSAQLAADADSFVCDGAVFVREVVASDVVAGMLESGYETWMASLPTEPPPGSGKRWNNNGIPAVTP
ncbi:hypothetical protein ACXR8U_13700 [Methylobacterium radiotolerans]|jgi:hypothetical protein|uniref:hypothetical protein n=1 Tax=Methylobacterium TaxID=407 RepID=UPI0005E5EE0F|nr:MULTISPECIES: hypothetical protein [Methylobacterium]MBN6824415.1 hypothetical protein [Methylobacterium organophilum]GAN49721.1 hypothetical protein ME121_3752 [Methylobacterium sp. ME121]